MSKTRRKRGKGRNTLLVEELLEVGDKGRIEGEEKEKEKEKEKEEKKFTENRSIFDNVILAKVATGMKVYTVREGNKKVHYRIPKNLTGVLKTAAKSSGLSVSEVIRLSIVTAIPTLPRLIRFTRYELVADESLKMENKMIRYMKAYLRSSGVYSAKAQQAILKKRGHGPLGIEEEKYIKWIFWAREAMAKKVRHSVIAMCEAGGMKIEEYDNKLMTCQECGKKVKRKDIRIHDMKFLCPDCFELVDIPTKAERLDYEINKQLEKRKKEREERDEWEV